MHHCWGKLATGLSGQSMLWKRSFDKSWERQKGAQVTTLASSWLLGRQIWASILLRSFPGGTQPLLWNYWTSNTHSQGYSIVLCNSVEHIHFKVFSLSMLSGLRLSTVSGGLDLGNILLVEFCLSETGPRVSLSPYICRPEKVLYLNC